MAALVELFDRGDIVAEAEVPHRRRWYRNLRLNAEEIEAGVAGAIRMNYRLTPQGGERWARHAGVDWQRWDGDQWSTTHYGQITTASRELTEFMFEREVRSGEARGPGRWSQVRPWNATYWHVEPVGYRVRYRVVQGQQIDSGRYPPVWRDSLPWGGRRPANLVERRHRELPVKPRPLEGLSEKQLEGRRWKGSPLEQLAVARELALRAQSVKELVDQLRIRCRMSRYCAARALGEQKAVEAVSALLEVVFNQHDVAAVEALGQIGDTRVLEPLLVLREHWRVGSSYHDANFSIALERAIVAFGDAAVARIEQLQAEGRIQLWSVWYTLALSRAPRAVLVLARYIREHHYPVMDLMARMGDEARAALFDVATGEHETESHRGGAARRLAETSGVFQDEARRIVAAMQASWNSIDMRWQVAYFTTGNWGAEVVDPIAAVLDVLRHSDAERRRIAVDLLVELDARHTAGEIAELAADESWSVRASVALALTRWGGHEEVIARLREDPDVIVRGCTLWFGDAG